MIQVSPEEARKNLERLRDHIAGLKHKGHTVGDRKGFNMRAVAARAPGEHQVTCNTACCIKGHAAVLFDKGDYYVQWNIYLGISLDVTRRLYNPIMALLYEQNLPHVSNDQGVEALNRITPRQAAKALQAVLDGKTETLDLWPHLRPWVKANLARKASTKETKA